MAQCSADSLTSQNSCGSLVEAVFNDSILVHYQARVPHLKLAILIRMPRFENAPSPLILWGLQYVTFYLIVKAKVHDLRI